MAEALRCPGCGGRLQVHKSKTRVLLTLAAGTVRAREVRKHCRHCPSRPVAGSQRLAALAPPRQRYGYDLIVWVGLARYHRHQQREEIRAALARQGIALSSGSVSALCDRFLRALQALHWQRAPALRAAMPHGYALHIDATSDKGRGGLFLCRDGCTGWVLHTVKVASENEPELRPAVERTVAAFGDPLAVLRDLGSAGAKAVAGCRQRGIPDLVCHFHFLAAVGQQLLDADYAALRSQITRSKLRSALRDQLRATRPAGPGRAPRVGLRADLPALLLWLLEGEGRKDLPYPFALPQRDFYRRCKQFSQELERRLPRPRTQPERRVLRTVSAALTGLERMVLLGRAAARLERRWEVFLELRAVLRLRDEELPRGARQRVSTRGAPAAAAARLEAIASDLEAYRMVLRQRVVAQRASRSGPPSLLPEAIVLRYLDRYGDALFGHPVVRDRTGRALVVVDRTNNVAEHFFATAKQNLRRRLGRAHLGRDMEDQPAQVALAANVCRTGPSGHHCNRTLATQQLGCRATSAQPCVG